MNCYLLENYRLCRCNVLIVILRLANYRLCRCNVLTEVLLLENYRLYRCSVLIEKLLLSKHRLNRCNVLIVILMFVKCRLCRCSVLVEMLLFASYRCRCKFVGVGLWLEYYCLLVIGCVVCCVVIGILFLESFSLCGCNAFSSVCYYYSSLTFEVGEVWCTDSTGASGWVSVE